MKKLFAILCSALVLLTGCILPAGAATSAELSAQIAEAKELRETAHQLAESARALGASEDHYCIWFAKQQWAKYNDQVNTLTAEYQAQLAAEQEKGTYLGNFKITFYCPCATCNGVSGQATASGAPLQPGVTIAVDSSVIPLGSKVYIEGIGWRTAQDTGGAITGNRIDVCVSSHSEAYALGVKYCDVYVK